ncbi:hypothetical protein LSH36_16g07049 [Paralvinella palmiformis]|uniref:Ubiquitin carboxyl-terminal hydrolase n=1 Tax=Paralvinella palmiformis TaxID=53620 RepID=A0AAD9KBX6_9ANNE|nr:hypothetical protein LSH36_16g07049 [Paralvinella palmiformis]
MIKGAVIKDDDWGNAKIKEGSTLLMMGSADELPKEPAEKPVFVEDMSDTQLAAALKMPAGLTNLGNTCYMNATLQCLRAIPELKDTLKGYTGQLGGALNPDESITTAVRDLYSQMDHTASAIPPIVMLQVLHMCYPQFAEKNEHGTYQQQDANECWTEIVRCLQRRLPASKLDNSKEAVSAAAASKGFIDQYMSGEFAITMKCIEAEEEEPTHSTETFYQLSCFIEKEVKYLYTGLKSRLEEHISKHSPTLGRDAQYSRKCEIRRLPAYITVQMVRFFYKEKEGVNAKILKDIKFPEILDVLDLCTEELKTKLIPARDRFKEEEDKKAEQLQEIKSKGTVSKEGETTDSKKMKALPYSFPDDPGSNNSGYYELQAVLTHKGRSSSSGHYVGWCRNKGDEWVMFDDDKVTAVTKEDILRLSGGGDWHCAYLLLYGPRILEIEEETTSDKASSESTPMESSSS